MITTLRCAAAATCLVVFAGAASAGPISPGDRQRLVAHLEMTEAWLVSEVAGLSAAQLAFRPGCLMISTHAQRHILQIRETKASPGYPKAK